VYWSSAARTNMLPGTMLSSSRGTHPLSESDIGNRKQLMSELND
jgi:hypothetical protein